MNVDMNQAFFAASASSAFEYRIPHAAGGAQTWAPGPGKVERLEAMVEELTKEVASLRQLVEGVEAREVSESQARIEVLAHYRSHQGALFPSDVAAELRLDPLLVKTVTDALVAEGVLA